MADPLTFESPVVKQYRTIASGDLVLADASATTKWLVRAASDGAAADFLAVPFGASRTAESGALVLGSRPGEWTLLGDAAAVAEVVSGLEAAAGSELVTALEWTHGRALFRLSGASAAKVLEKVCNLDWSDPMTPDGAVVSASVASVTCDIARNDVDDKPSCLLLCDRSFGQYLFDALLDAGAEFDLSVQS